MSEFTWTCPHCNRSNFKSQGGLTKHQKHNILCKRKMNAAFGYNLEEKSSAHFLSLQRVSNDDESSNSSEKGNKKARGADKLVENRSDSGFQSKTGGTCDRLQVNDDDFPCLEVDSFERNTMHDSDASDDGKNSTNLNVDQNMRLNFKSFCAHSSEHAGVMPKNLKTSVELLAILRAEKCSLKSHETMLKWHLSQTGALEPSKSLSDCTSYLSKQRVYSILRDRYNYPKQGFSSVHFVTLPHSKSRVKIVRNSAKHIIASLLSDPRINDSDYMFFGNDPLAAPPDDIKYIKDLNTGRAHTATYKKLITRPGKQVLLPVIFYVDAANAGHFSDLPITAVKISLGIFSRKARDKDMFWRILGFLPEYSKHTSRAKRIAYESMHADGVFALNDADGEEGLRHNASTCKAQDLHCCLSKILEECVELQKTGFMWDLRFNGRTYGVEFVLFTPFMKLDSDEAEKLCGKYTSRASNVKQLCRYCTVPTSLSDSVTKTFPLKETGVIAKLALNNEEEELKNMSQHNISNALCEVRFGMHNNQGVHGACPMEMLHALLLGIFKYVRDCFFQQIGPTSKLADEVNSLAQQCGQYLSRQSDRNLPKTRFSKGTRKGKLMAKEYPGILLCMLTVLHSNKGKGLLSRKEHFKDKAIIQDWKLLIETLLQWEMWLKSNKMKISDAIKAQAKHRVIMHLIKKIGKRVEGMGLKIIKFHGITHLADDTLNFGVPMEVDTGSNERGHKATKKAAKLTQKIAENFDEQTMRRLEEVQLLDLALEELNGNCIWDYYNCSRTGVIKEKLKDKTMVGGGTITCQCNDEKDLNVAKLVSRCRKKIRFVWSKIW